MTTRLYEIEPIPELGAARILLAPSIKALPPRQAAEKLNKRLAKLHDEVERHETELLNDECPVAESLGRIRQLHLEMELVQQSIAHIRERIPMEVPYRLKPEATDAAVEQARQKHTEWIIRNCQTEDQKTNFNDRQ